MRKDGPPLLFVALWGVFAAAMLFGQQAMVSRGITLASIIDIEDPEVLQVAALD